MKKRIAFILISTFIAIGTLTAVILSQISESPPAQAQHVLDEYLLNQYPEGAVTTIQYAKDRERFTADLAYQINQSPVSENRPSPVLYDGEIIRPPERDGRFPFPAHEVWCVTVTSNGHQPQYLFLARHDTLYDESWVLYQSSNGRQSQASIGCVN